MVSGRRNPAHVDLPKRLRHARKVQGIRTRQLGAMLGASTSNGTISGIETGRAVPRVDTVERIAVLLQISPGWLAFGRGSAATVHDPTADVLRSDALPERLRQAREARGLTYTELARQSDISRPMWYYVESGKSTPTVTTVDEIAKALKISPNWLAYGEGEMELPSRRRKGEDVGEDDEPQE